jgi:hypothetical protein
MHDFFRICNFYAGEFFRPEIDLKKILAISVLADMRLS